MNDKKESEQKYTKNNRESIVLDRLKKLIDTDTRAKIAEYLGCDVSLVTYHYNGDRNVTTGYLIKYAQYFNVSADYLLGLTPNPTTDKDLNSVCEYIGLSEQSVYTLVNIKNNNSEYNKILNSMLAELPEVLLVLNSFKNYRDEIEKTNNSLSDNKKSAVEKKLSIIESKRDWEYKEYQIMNAVRHLNDKLNYEENCSRRYRLCGP